MSSAIRFWRAFGVIVAAVASAVALTAPSASATVVRNCKQGWVAHHNYHVDRLRTMDLGCGKAMAVLDRYLSTGVVPHGWRSYTPHRPFVGGLSRRGAPGALIFTGWYDEGE